MICIGGPNNWVSTARPPEVRSAGGRPSGWVREESSLLERGLGVSSREIFEIVYRKLCILSQFDQVGLHLKVALILRIINGCFFIRRIPVACNWNVKAY